MREYRPENLKLARERRFYPKTHLAQQLGITAKTLADFECLTEPPAEMLSKIARVLNFPEDFFFHEQQLSPIDPGIISFRAYSKIRTITRHSACAAARIATLIGIEAEKRFVLPDSSIPELEFVDRSPEDAARLVREEWGLSDKPIRNMIHLLEKHGVRVFSLPDDTKEVNAFSFWDEGTPYVFLVQNTSAQRCRFDCAHELGHLVLHRYKHNKLGSSGIRGGRHPDRCMESEADAFASAFLMPEHSVYAHAPRNPSLADLDAARHKWNVSIPALCVRMHRLNLINNWRYQRLFIEMSRAGLRTHETADGTWERSQVWEKVTRLLRERGGWIDFCHAVKLTPSEAASMMFGLMPMVISGSQRGGPGAR